MHVHNNGNTCTFVFGGQGVCVFGRALPLAVGNVNNNNVHL